MVNPATPIYRAISYGISNDLTRWEFNCWVFDPATSSLMATLDPHVSENPTHIVSLVRGEVPFTWNRAYASQANSVYSLEVDEKCKFTKVLRHDYPLRYKDSFAAITSVHFTPPVTEFLLTVNKHKSLSGNGISVNETAEFSIAEHLPWDCQECNDSDEVFGVFWPGPQNGDVAYIPVKENGKNYIKLEWKFGGMANENWDRGDLVERRLAFHLRGPSATDLLFALDVGENKLRVLDMPPLGHPGRNSPEFDLAKVGFPTNDYQAKDVAIPPFWADQDRSVVFVTFSVSVSQEIAPPGIAPRDSQERRGEIAVIEYKPADTSFTLLRRQPFATTNDIGFMNFDRKGRYLAIPQALYTLQNGQPNWSNNILEVWDTGIIPGRPYDASALKLVMTVPSYVTDWVWLD